MSAIRGVKGFLPFEKPKSSKSDTIEGEDQTANRTENQKVREVADLYEKFFIKELMRHMKSGLNEDGGMIKKNNAEKIFSEQLDEQYASQWNQRGGFGISDMIYENITERYGVNVGEKPASDGKNFNVKASQGANNTLAKPEDLSHEQMLWQIEMNQKDLKK